MLKKIIKLVSTVALCLVLAGITANAENTEIHNPSKVEGEPTDFSKIYFGSYPQSELDSEADKDIIEKITATLGYDFKHGIDNVGDCRVDGAMYRKICTNADTTDKVKVYKYFKWEPIRWRVHQVDKENNCLFVSADIELDCKKYNESFRPVTWETCTMRSYLNGYTADKNIDGISYAKDGDNFLNSAFSNIERAAILDTLVKNEEGKNTDLPDPESVNAGPDTFDKIFLLSSKEVYNTQYGYSSVGVCSERILATTDYAITYGAISDNSGSFYWLRSPGYAGFNVEDKSSHNRYAEAIQGMSPNNNFRVDSTSFSVVPALRLKLDSNLYYTECPDEVMGAEGGIVYHLFDGENNSENPISFAPGSDAMITLKDPVKIGYRFTGWYTDPGYSRDSRVRIIEVPKRGNLELYAKWEEVSEARIIYELNGGTNAFNPDKYTYGVGVTAFKAPSKAACIFDGWYFDKAFTQKAEMISNTMTGDVVLYAKWIEKAANKISIANKTINLNCKNSKQTADLKASANGAALSFVSSDSKITVSADGKVSLPAKWIGEASITITAAENERYLSAKETVTIKAGLSKVKKLTLKNTKTGQIKVSWTADKISDGYQIKYSTKKNMASSKTKTLKKGTSKSTVIEKLKSDKTVYVKIRSFKKVGKKTYYSDYSDTKKIKVK